MDRHAIRKVFEMLAGSQGLYGRILNTIDNEMTDEERETFWQTLEEANLKDSVDVVLFMES